MFINSGWNINCKIPETDGCTILHIMAGIETTSKKNEILSLLLEMGADPNERSYDDLTPVHIAAMWNNCFELEKLLQHGGNPWLLDNENKNSFDLAADNHAYEAYQLLNQYVANDKLNFINRGNKNNIKSQLFNERSDKQKCTSSDSFYSAEEDFPLLFSSSDEETVSFIINVSEMGKKKNLRKQLSKFETEKHDLSRKMNTSLRSDISDKNVLNNAMISNAKEKFNSNCCSDQKNNNNNNPETIVESDEVSGIILVEQSNTSIPNSSALNIKCGVCNDWKSFVSGNSTSSACSSSSFHNAAVLKEFSNFSDSKIFQELINLGDKPGPVNKFTRKVYEERLARFKNGYEVPCILPESKYCSELHLFLSNKITLEEIDQYGNAMAEDFNNSKTETDRREGNRKNCFNYFLLDPRITQNLPMRYSTMKFKEMFQIFVNAIFYVGKGTKGRPYLHLLDAAKAMAGLHARTDKINHILDIWSSGHGVISLHCFHNCIPVEAYTKEACIIEALGLKNLTNQKAGHYYGQTNKWSRSWKRKAGISFLNRALQILLCEGEKQIKAKDLKGN